MKSFTKVYSKINNQIINIQETVDNNVRMINESQFIIDHGKDIDNLLYRFRSYTYNNLYNANKFNEDNNEYKLTLNESQTFRDLMIYICEDYRSKLLEELNIYESLIVDGELITEGVLDKLKEKSKNIVGNIKATWEAGKEKVKQAIETLKSKIKEVNELIKDYANQAVNTVKGMAIRLIELLNKFNCTLEGLFKKMGFENLEQEEKSVEEIANSLASNPDYLKKTNVYESYANSIIDSQINEDDKKDVEVVQDQDKGNTILFGKVKVGKTAKMIWEAFKQLMIWATVCVIIPGTVCAFFPGTFIALLVPLACKLGWNCYKIVKICKQWKKLMEEWKTYNKKQKFIAAFSMIASIIALFFNFKTLVSDGGKILEAFSKTGGGLLEKANLGIQPDKLTKGFAAFINMLRKGKFNIEDFKETYGEISTSFEKHVLSIQEKVVSTTAEFGKAGKEVLDQFEKGSYKTPQEWWEVGKKLGMSAKEINDLKDNDTIDVVMDGFYQVGKGGNSWSEKALKIAKGLGMEEYLKSDQALNKGLHNIFSGQGSIVGMKMPVKLYRALSNAGCCGNKNVCTVIGGVAQSLSKTSIVKDIVAAGMNMAATIPMVEFVPQNNKGFRVRLGGEKEKENYIYEVGEDGVREVEMSKFKESYDKIKQYVQKDNNEFLKSLEETLKDEKISDDDKKKIENAKKDIENKNKEIDNIKGIVFYGKKVIEESSLMSLSNYIIKEEKKAETIDDVKKNLIELRNHLIKKCNNVKIEKNENDKNTQENTFKGNVNMLLQRIFSFKSEYKYSDSIDDDKLSYKDKKDKKIYTVSDIDIVSLFLTKYVYNDTNDDKYYQHIRHALADVTMIKNQIKEDPNAKEINDIIKGSYMNMKEFFQKSPKFKKESEGDNPEWEPLYFEEVDDETQNKIENAENSLPKSSIKDTENQLENDGVEIPEPPKNDESENDEQDQSENKDDKEIPILIFANNYGLDIADATKSGPRKDVYSLKGVFHSLQFIEIKGGTSKTNIQKLLGDILANQTTNLFNIVINKPCNDEKPYKLNSWVKGDEERDDYGKLTNQNIIDIMNDEKKAIDLILEKSSISIVSTKEDKEYQEDKKKEYKGKLENADEETIKLVKEIDPKAIDDKGKIKDVDSLSGKLSEYKLAQHKASDIKKSGGLWTKLKNFVKGLFGGNKDEGKRYNNLLKHIDPEKPNEGLNEISYDLFLEEMFKSKTLAEYILERSF